MYVRSDLEGKARWELRSICDTMGLPPEEIKSALSAGKAENLIDLILESQGNGSAVEEAPPEVSRKNGRPAAPAARSVRASARETAKEEAPAAPSRRGRPPRASERAEAEEVSAPATPSRRGRPAKAAEEEAPKEPAARGRSLPARGARAAEAEEKPSRPAKAAAREEAPAEESYEDLVLEATQRVLEELGDLRKAITELSERPAAPTEGGSVDDLSIAVNELRYDMIIVRELLAHIGTALENSAVIDAKEAPGGLSAEAKLVELDREFGPK